MGLSEAHRQRIVVSVDWFPPAFRAGGPIRSTFNLVSLLANTYDVWVISGAYDLGQDRFRWMSLWIRGKQSNVAPEAFR